jgi:hypothetical protein
MLWRVEYTRNGLERFCIIEAASIPDARRMVRIYMPDCVITSVIKA